MVAHGRRSVNRARLPGNHRHKRARPPNRDALQAASETCDATQKAPEAEDREHRRWDSPSRARARALEVDRGDRRAAERGPHPSEGTCDTVAGARGRLHSIAVATGVRRPTGKAEAVGRLGRNQARRRRETGGRQPSSSGLRSPVDPSTGDAQQAPWVQAPCHSAQPKLNRIAPPTSFLHCSSHSVTWLGAASLS